MKLGLSDERFAVTRLLLIPVAAAVAWGVNLSFPNRSTFLIACMLSMGAIMVLMAFVLVMASDVAQAVIWPRGVSTLDDRGQKVWLGDPRKMPAPIQMDRAVNDTLNKWMRAHKPSAGTWLRALAGAGLRILTIMIAVSFVRSWTACFVAAPALLFIGPLAWRPVNTMVVRLRGRAFVAIGRCPCCGYELSQLSIEPDGCVVCPECGAAWRRTEGKPAP